MPPQTAPGKGRSEATIGQRPLRGAAQVAAFTEIKSPRAQVAGFVWKQVPDAHASYCRLSAAGRFLSRAKLIDPQCAPTKRDSHPITYT
jgi:hypothetical protein